MLERIFRIGVLTVAIDPDKIDPFRAEPLSGLSGRLIRTNNIGAMVASKENHECIGSEVVERIGLPICRRELEVGSLIANG